MVALASPGSRPPGQVAPSSPEPGAAAEAAMAAFAIGPEGRLTWWSGRPAELLGIAEEALALGMDVRVLLGRVGRRWRGPDDLARALEAGCALRQLWRSVAGELLDVELHAARDSAMRVVMFRERSAEARLAVARVSHLTLLDAAVRQLAPVSALFGAGGEVIDLTPAMRRLVGIAADGIPELHPPELAARLASSLGPARLWAHVAALPHACTGTDGREATFHAPTAQGRRIRFRLARCPTGWLLLGGETDASSGCGRARSPEGAGLQGRDDGRASGAV